MRALGRPALIGAVVAASAGACGVPSYSPPVAITAVPYGLMSGTAAATLGPATQATRGPFVYLLDSKDRLIPVEVGPVSEDPIGAITTVLTRLAGGPTEEQRRGGLSTALGSEVALRLHLLEGGRAEIEIDIGTPAPSAGRLPRAVGQIVLSATSIPEVGSVVLTNDGLPIAAPLPDGVLTDRPLTATDYDALLGP